MRRPAKILLAGALLTMPMLPPLSGVATSQTVSQIGQSGSPASQVNLGDVFAAQTLNVDVNEQDGTTSAVTTSTGNGLLTGVQSGSLDVHLSQTNGATTTDTTINPSGQYGSINAYTAINSSGYLGAAAVINTAATANTAEADIQGGGALTGTFTQSEIGPPTQASPADGQPMDPTCRGQTSTGSISNGCVKSENDFNASAGYAGSVSASSQAIANSLTFGVDGSTSNVTTNQSNSATVTAESGSEVTGGATINDVTTDGGASGTAAFSAIAVANNITATGVNSSSQTINATQTASGQQVLADQFLTAGTGQALEGAAAASANNISATNEGGDLNVTDNQTNSSFVFADSLTSAFEFGSGQSTASGVGNTVLAANQGPTTEVSNTQVNNGGIEAQAVFNATGGSPAYDAVTSATAIGNAATGFACTTCGGVIQVANTQTNTGGVGAFTTVNATGGVRSVSSVATAVGNNASYYSSKPSN